MEDLDLTSPSEAKKAVARRPKVIVMILTYNCARMLPRAIERIPTDLVDDMFVSDDGSTDKIEEATDLLGLKLYRHVPNQGYGANVKRGLRKALEMGADYVVEIHGDGAQFDPSAIAPAVPLMEDGAHFILGSRFQIPKLALQNGMPYKRYIANRMLSTVDKLVLRLPLTEFHTGFRIYSRKMLDVVSFEENSNGYLFSFEIIAQAAYHGLKVVEVPVEADYKNEHTSHDLRGAALYSISTFGILGAYLLAKLGIRYDRVFPRKNVDASQSNSRP